MTRSYSRCFSKNCQLTSKRSHTFLKGCLFDYLFVCLFVETRSSSVETMKVSTGSCDNPPASASQIWDYRCVPPCLAPSHLFFFFFVPSPIPHRSPLPLPMLASLVLRHGQCLCGSPLHPLLAAKLSSVHLK